MHNPTAPPPTSGVTIEPFRIDVPEAVLIDLHERLARVRWPDEPPGAGWNYGTDLTYLRNLVRYWRDEYDRRAREMRLNRFPQFRTREGDALVHFIHQVGEGPSPYPPGEKVRVPTGYAEFPEEILSPPWSLAATIYAGLRRWTPMARGGHFAALEEPDALAHEIREFFRPLRAAEQGVGRG
ncbi:MAG: epoxide hydrolase N-terminal domain-containing protein [Verrucomicrobia bacterium]|nr:epoxide hydrolase N-terminal domain-containing protein [Verrucomicrobiota bacterium]